LGPIEGAPTTIRLIRIEQLKESIIPPAEERREAQLRFGVGGLRIFGRALEPEVCICS